MHDGPVTIIRIVGACQHPPVPPANGAVHASDRDRAAIAQFAPSSNGMFAVPTQQQLVHALSNTGAPLLSQAMRMQARAVTQLARASVPARATPHGTQLLASEVLRLRDHFQPRGVRFVHREGTGALDDLRMQCTWYTEEKRALLQRAIELQGTIGSLWCDMTFQTVGGRFNLITVLFFDADRGRYAPLLQALVECHENGGSLDTLSWCRIWLDLFVAFPELIHREFLRVDSVVMDFELAERKGFCLALEASVRQRMLDPANPTYAANLALHNSIAQGTFPPRQPLAALQGAARQQCDELLAAGYARFAHGLIGCDFHLGNNLHRATISFDTSDANERERSDALRRRLAILRNRDVSEELTEQRAQEIRAELLADENMRTLPRPVQNWLAANLENDEVATMWIGALRIAHHARYVERLTATINSSPNDPALEQLLNRAQDPARVRDNISPQTNNPLESFHSRLPLIVGHGTARRGVPPASAVDACCAHMLDNDAERRAVQSGLTTVHTRAAQRNASLVETAIRDGRHVGRQNSNRSSMMLPHGTRVQYNSRARVSAASRGHSLSATLTVDDQVHFHRCRAAVQSIRSHHNTRPLILPLFHTLIERALLTADAADSVVLLVLAPLEPQPSAESPSSTRDQVRTRNQQRQAIRQFINATGLFHSQPISEHPLPASLSAAADGYVAYELRASNRSLSVALLRAISADIEQSAIGDVRLQQRILNPLNETYDGLFQCSTWLSERLRSLFACTRGCARIVRIGANQRADEFDIGAAAVVRSDAIASDRHAMLFVRQARAHRTDDVIDLASEEEEDLDLWSFNELDMPPPHRRRTESEDERRGEQVDASFAATASGNNGESSDIDESAGSQTIESHATFVHNAVRESLDAISARSPSRAATVASAAATVESADERALREGIALAESYENAQANQWAQMIEEHIPLVRNAICAILEANADTIRAAVREDVCMYCHERTPTIDIGCTAAQECALTGLLCTNCIAASATVNLGRYARLDERRRVANLIAQQHATPEQIQAELLKIALRLNLCQQRCPVTLDRLLCAHRAADDHRHQSMGESLSTLDALIEIAFAISLSIGGQRAAWRATQLVAQYCRQGSNATAGREEHEQEQQHEQANETPSSTAAVESTTRPQQAAPISSPSSSHASSTARQSATEQLAVGGQGQPIILNLDQAIAQGMSLDARRAAWLNGTLQEVRLDWQSDRTQSALLVPLLTAIAAQTDQEADAVIAHIVLVGVTGTHEIVHFVRRMLEDNEYRPATNTCMEIRSFRGGYFQADLQERFVQSFDAALNRTITHYINAFDGAGEEVSNRLAAIPVGVDGESLEHMRVNSILSQWAAATWHHYSNRRRRGHQQQPRQG